LASYQLGNYLLRRNDLAAAREAWANPYVDSTSLLDWAWRTADRPAETRIDLGAGLDFGLIEGFYPAETLAESTARVQPVGQPLMRACACQQARLGLYGCGLPIHGQAMRQQQICKSALPSNTVSKSRSLGPSGGCCICQLLQVQTNVKLNY
jgi:hypothetical protein